MLASHSTGSASPFFPKFLTILLSHRRLILQTTRPVFLVTRDPFISGFSADIPQAAQVCHRPLSSPYLLNEIVSLFELSFVFPEHKRPRSVTQAVSLKCYQCSESAPSVEPCS